MVINNKTRFLMIISGLFTLTACSDGGVEGNKYKSLICGDDEVEALRCGKGCKPIDPALNHEFHLDQTQGKLTQKVTNIPGFPSVIHGYSDCFIFDKNNLECSAIQDNEVKDVISKKIIRISEGLIVEIQKVTNPTTGYNKSHYSCYK